MIIDCFTFLNEIEILESRLKYLDSIVDYFVLVESNITFSGKHKPLYFIENQLRFNKYKHKIIYMPFIFDNTKYNFDFSFDESQKHSVWTHPAWKIETMQRNTIAEAVKMIDDDCFVILGDVDEIPSKGALNYAMSMLNPEKPVTSFVTKYFYYNLNTMDPLEWPTTLLTKKKFLIEKTPSFLRENIRNSQYMPHIYNGGWHLSYFGNAERLKYKIESFSHQEFNKESFKDTERLERCLKRGVSLFNEDIEYIKVTKDFFPEDFLNAFSQFLSEE